MSGPTGYVYQMHWDKKECFQHYIAIHDTGIPCTVIMKMAPWLNMLDLKDCETETLYIYYLVSFMLGGFVNGQVQKFQSHAVKYISCI